MSFCCEQYTKCQAYTDKTQLSKSEKKKPKQNLLIYNLEGKSKKKNQLLSFKKFPF